MSRFIDIPIDEIHLKIIDLVKHSDMFENELHNVFTSILLDMFIYNNDGLEFFFERYSPTIEDFQIFFKEHIIEYFDEDTYYEIEKTIFGDVEDEW